jgi:outer membrane protein
MFSWTGLRPSLVCLALFAFSQIAPAQTKVAVINLQKAVFETAEINKANTEMQAKFKPRQDAIDQLQKEIATLSQQLQTSGDKLSSQAYSDLTAQGQQKQRSLQRLQDDLQADVTAYRNEILAKSSEKMTAVVKKIAEEKGYDLVIDVSTTLYFKPAMDITTDATAGYNAAYPAK